MSTEGRDSVSAAASALLTVLSRRSRRIGGKREGIRGPGWSQLKVEFEFLGQVDPAEDESSQSQSEEHDEDR